MVRLIFGGRTPETKLTIKEIADKMQFVARDLNKVVTRHAAITDPLLRAANERQILDNFFKLEDFAAKFKKSFLNRVARNARYIGKLISGMSLQSVLARWPNPSQSLQNYKDHTNGTLDTFKKLEFDEIQKAYGLRNFASEVKKKVKTNITNTVKAITQKVNSYNKQQQTAQVNQELTAKQRQEQATAGKKPKLVPKLGT
jgi:hypothetical protein